MSHPKLLFIESHGPLARLLKETLEREIGLIVAGEVGTVGEALPLLLTGSIDVVIIDLNVADMGRLEAISSILESAPGTQVILLIDQDDQRYYEAAAEKGVQACVPKQLIATELVPTVQSVLVN